MQTFMSVFRDANGKIVDLDSWEDSQVDVCLKKLFKLYAKLDNTTKTSLSDATRVVIYQTDYYCCEDNKVKEMDIDAFWKTVAETKQHLVKENSHDEKKRSDHACKN